MDSAPGTAGDYAACIGTTGYDDSLVVVNGNWIPVPEPTGAFRAKKGVSLTNGFGDGTSNTLLVGEKGIPDGLTMTYPWDCNLYDGHNIVCSTRSAGPGFPLASSRTDRRLVFGGPHPGICQFVFADGGVRSVRTGVSEFVLGQLAHCNDGLILPSEY